MIGLRHEAGSDTLWVTPDHRVLVPRRVTALSPRGQWSGVPEVNFERGRAMRREMSPPERALWRHLRSGQIGLKVRRQHPIGPYIADFYARDAGLVVEVDGQQHGDSQAAVAYDRRRDEYMEAMGLRVVRFPATEVINNPRAVVQSVLIACREHVLRDDRSKQWCAAANLRLGDRVFCGPHRRAVRLVAIERQPVAEDVFGLEVEDAHSFVTETCTVHDCGSGAVAGQSAPRSSPHV
jgi:very-short-patch-repair endonuclease